jgi:CspA family cold shock protein
MVYKVTNPIRVGAGDVKCNGKEVLVVMALEGTVKWFNESKGYGFIQQENGTDVFVHYSSISGDGFKTLTKGQRVQFEITSDEKGPKAVDVVKM